MMYSRLTEFTFKMLNKHNINVDDITITVTVPITKTKTLTSILNKAINNRYIVKINWLNPDDPIVMEPVDITKGLSYFEKLLFAAGLIDYFDRKHYPNRGKCTDCNISYNFHIFPELYIPDDLWLKIYGSESGYLCAQCILDRIYNKDEKLFEQYLNQVYNKMKNSYQNIIEKQAGICKYCNRNYVSYIAPEKFWKLLKLDPNENICLSCLAASLNIITIVFLELSDYYRGD